MGAYEHGTISRYTAKKCRCDLCKAANRKYMQDYKAKRKAQLPSVPNELRACDACGTLYVAKATSRQRFCRPRCANLRLATCKKCKVRYEHVGVHHSVDPWLCSKCLDGIVQRGLSCPICQIPWWSPGSNKCCSNKCFDLFNAKRALMWSKP
jgi:hypothetical protein